MRKFPKNLYIVKEGDGDEEYFISFESIEDIDIDKRGDLIGLYEFKESKTLKVNKTLE